MGYSSLYIVHYNIQWGTHLCTQGAPVVNGTSAVIATGVAWLACWPDHSHDLSSNLEYYHYVIVIGFNYVVVFYIVIVSRDFIMTSSL